MEDSFESVQMTDDEITELIETSYKINRFIRISDFNKKVDAAMVSMMLEDSYITRDFNNIYNLISPFSKKVHESELELEEKPKFNEKSIQLKKYKSENQVRNLLQKTNTDLITLKHYIKDHDKLEFFEETATLCNYLYDIVDKMHKSIEKKEKEIKENLKF